MTIQPPFLELSYYVGVARTGDALEQIGVRKEAIGNRKKICFPGIVGISEQQEEVDAIEGRLILRTEGELFSGVERGNTQTVRELGLVVYRRFLEVARSIDCCYGAILFEYTLELPDELRNSKSLAFRNFYLSSKRLSKKTLKAVELEAGAEAFIEEDAEGGMYVSMTADFNPRAQSLDPIDAQERSVRIAEIVANNF
jgi:hypothetical protein